MMTISDTGKFPRFFLTVEMLHDTKTRWSFSYLSEVRMAIDANAGAPKKILLVEDSVTMQKVVQMALGAESYSITSVSSGDEAIDTAKEMQPDIVIADLSLDGKDGYAICSALKGRDASVRVILLHGSAAPYDEGKAKAAAADGEVKKPFDSQVFIDKVNSLATVKPVVAAKKTLGPVEPLSTPIETEIEDVVIDTGVPDTKPPAPVAPLVKPVVPAMKPATPAKAPPVVAPPPSPAIQAAKPQVADPRPASIPAAPVVPAIPQPKVPVPAVAGVDAGSEAVEIVIEAEPPPPGSMELLPPFDSIQLENKGAAPAEPRPDATQLGMGVDLPPPPAGMPLPPLAVPPSELSKPAAASLGDQLDPVVLDAITKISHEVIEKIVWEVVPDLAEKIIKEELDRLVENRRQ